MSRWIKLLVVLTTLATGSVAAWTGDLVVGAIAIWMGVITVPILVSHRPIRAMGATMEAAGLPPPPSPDPALPLRLPAPPRQGRRTMVQDLPAFDPEASERRLLASIASQRFPRAAHDASDLLAYTLEHGRPLAPVIAASVVLAMATQGRSHWAREVVPDLDKIADSEIRAQVDEILNIASIYAARRRGKRALGQAVAKVHARCPRALENFKPRDHEMRLAFSAHAAGLRNAAVRANKIKSRARTEPEEVAAEEIGGIDEGDPA